MQDFIVPELHQLTLLLWLSVWYYCAKLHHRLHFEAGHGETNLEVVLHEFGSHFMYLYVVAQST